MEDGPPINFQNIRDEHEKIECKLCETKRSKFICATCINTGNFHHSTSFLKDSFKEKKLKLENNENASQIWHARADVIFRKKRAQENLVYSIKETKLRIEWSKQLIEIRKKEIQSAKENLKKRTREIEFLKRNFSILKNKVGEEENILQAKRDLMERDDLEKLSAELKEFIRSNISQIVKYIFPLYFVPENQDASGQFGDTARSVMVQDKSVVAQAANSGNYVIVAPYLPTDGDYNIYKDWVLANRHDTTTTGENPLTKSTHRIFDALMYTSQFVKILAYYLNIRLPFRWNLNDFLCSDISEKEFNRRVAHLNANIIYICYKQHINLKSLTPTHTLENLHKLLVLGEGDLGRIGYCDWNLYFKIEKGKEEDEKPSDEIIPAHLGESNSDDSEEGNLAGWEHLPVDLPSRAPVVPMQSSFVQSVNSFLGTWNRWRK